MTQNLENDYEVKLKINEEIFKYSSVKKESVLLFGHYELPQNMTFTKPALTKNGQYLTAIGQEEKIDHLFIWKADQLHTEPYLVFKGTSKIEGVEFCQDNKKIIIVYKEEPPIVYDIENKKIILKCAEIKTVRTKILTFCLASKNVHFGVASDKDFLVYNIETGKISKLFVSSNEIKVIRNLNVYFIDQGGYVKVYDIKKGDEIKSFQIKDVNSMKGVIVVMVSPDNNFIFYMKATGIYKVQIDTGKNKEIKKLEGVVKGEFSEDCKIAMTTTDMTEAIFWNLENGESIGSLFREKFESFSVNFPQSKILTVNKYCISIADILDAKAAEQFIWLDLNPTKFEKVYYSPDFLVLFAIIDEHYAISYNTFSGEVIKKWKNPMKFWSEGCLMVPETAQMGVIVTKGDEKTIKIWDYLTGTDLATFVGFCSYSFGFNKQGNLLAASAKDGPEICRVYDLETGDYSSFIFKGENNNTKTRVCITKSNPLKVIAIAEKQNPVIFDYKTKQLIFVCEEFPAELYKILKIECNSKNIAFYVLGKDRHDIDTAILMGIEKGAFICEYNNCRNIEFDNSHKYLISDSDDVNPKNLSITHLENLDNVKVIECEVTGNKSKFLQDNKTVASLVTDENDPNMFTYKLNDAETGRPVAELEVIKKTERYTITSLLANKKENYLLFRFVELNNPKKK